MSYATHCIPWDETCGICNPPSRLGGDQDATARCPDSPRFPGDLVGCGSTHVVRDEHGEYDCLDCGLWFTLDATEPADV